MPAPPLRPTVFYFCRLGDMVMLSALLNLLHRRFHLPCQVIGAGSWNESVYEGNPDVAHVWSFGRHMPFPVSAAWPAVKRALRASAPGPIYICERHYRQLPRIRRMLSFSGVDPARCVFLTEQPQSGDAHWMDRLVHLGERTPPALHTADYPVPAGVQWAPRLHVADSARAEGDAWIKAHGGADRELILVQPGNHRSMSRRRRRWRRLNADDKAWPPENWVTLLNKIHARKPHALIVLRGSVEEVPMLREIQAAVDHPQAVAVAGFDLRRLFALCEAAHSMISVDTGPAHAAAALGLPLVVMYGAGSPHHWSPRSPTGSPVLSVGGPPESTRVDQISVDDVFATWCVLVEQTQAQAVSQDQTLPRRARG